MILREAVANAKMRIAGLADVVCSDAADRTTTANCAVSVVVHADAEVLAGQRMSRVGARSTLARRVLGR